MKPVLAIPFYALVGLLSFTSLTAQTAADYQCRPIGSGRGDATACTGT
jgi:hypothetical protein